MGNGNQITISQFLFTLAFLCLQASDNNMTTNQNDNLVQELSVLGRNAQLSLTARQRVRDQLFKKIGQLDLVDAVQTNTEVPGLVMPLSALLSIFKPRRVSFGIPATAGIALGLAALTFATGTLAGQAEPGSGVFYTVRRVLETAQVALATDPEKKAELKLSIANDRLQAVQGATDPRALQAALEESKKALAEAQTAVSSPKVKATAKDDLNIKLATIIGNQKTLLTTIVKDNLASDAVKEGILAFRDELDNLITPDGDPVITENTTKKPDADKPETTVIPVTPASFRGSFITSYGRPALNTGEKIYVLTNVTSELSQYVGSRFAEVYGKIVDGVLVADRVFIDSKLVWESPSKINNNLPRVEGDQNNHLVNPSN